MAAQARRAGSLDDRATALLSPDGLRPVFQPVVDLETGVVVGFEALARTRPDAADVSPQDMFAWARSRGHLSTLDWSCRCAAFRGAADAGIHPPLTLLVNAEPAALDSSAPPELWADVHLARRRLRITVELTERQLAHSPLQLFHVVDSMRALGWGIALDDVGAEPASLALLPLLQPDVIKLDRSVLLDPTDPNHAASLHAASTEAERTGAAIVAEGIETPRQAVLARSLGATYGQGYLWGIPTARPHVDRAAVVTGLPKMLAGRHTVAHRSAASPQPQLMDAAEVDARIELMIQMAEGSHTCVLLVSWPDPGTADRWRRRLMSAALRCTFVGSAVSAVPGLPTTDTGYELTVLGPYDGATLTAHPNGAPRTWNVVNDHQRETAIVTGQRLVRRTVPVTATTSLPDQRGRSSR